MKHKCVKERGDEGASGAQIGVKCFKSFQRLRRQAEMIGHSRVLSNRASAAKTLSLKGSANYGRRLSDDGSSAPQAPTALATCFCSHQSITRL